MVTRLSWLPTVQSFLSLYLWARRHQLPTLALWTAYLYSTCHFDRRSNALAAGSPSPVNRRHHKQTNKPINCRTRICFTCGVEWSLGANLNMNNAFNMVNGRRQRSVWKLINGMGKHSHSNFDCLLLFGRIEFDIRADGNCSLYDTSLLLQLFSSCELFASECVGRFNGKFDAKWHQLLFLYAFACVWIFHLNRLPQVLCDSRWDGVDRVNGNACS